MGDNWKRFESHRVLCRPFFIKVARTDLTGVLAGEVASAVLPVVYCPYRSQKG